jgi:hypothetical protein
MACGVRVDLNESTFVISRVTKTYTLKYGRYVETRNEEWRWKV